ncbi:MAG: hypothetical protein FGM39_08635 [Phycisphaerales bacterium]|nr:hypothetical protein [Phycisphaerales bacterium]
MLAAARRLLLGFLLIAAASAVLVLTDRSRTRPAAGGTEPKRIAIVQISSIDAMNTARDALVARLEAAGHTAAAGTVIERFNAEGDVGTLGQMAAQACGASPPFDVVISLSTPATQAVMRANRAGVPQVFGLVASPPAIGVPLGPWTPGSTRPEHVAGFGTLQPAELLFGALRAAAPGARRVGCVWNPAEPNAEASVKLGREVCATLGMELVEANGANVTEVVSAADVVLSRGIDCFWILADTNVIAAAKPVIERCRRSGVPVITNFPAMAELGAAINYGADYAAMGTSTGAIAELVLAGTPPRDIPCDNFVPVAVWLNYDGFGAGWRRPADLERAAGRIVEGGTARTQAVGRTDVPPAVAQLLAARAAARTAGGRLPVVAAITYSRTPNFEDAYRGFLDEMEAIGLGDGVGARIVLRDAQLDIGALGTIVAAVSAERPDVVVPFTTPALQAVSRRIRDLPVVFSLVASGIEAGAGRSATDHLPNVTGAQIEGDWTRMVEVLKAAMPAAKRVGTVFAPGEANSVFSKESWRKALAAAGIELVAVGADRPTELSEAADGLVTQGIDAVAQISDNSSSMGFATIVRAADRAGIAVFSFTPGSMRAGATFAVARDFEDVGRVSARLVKRVLAGESVAGIPFADAERTVLYANPDRLRRFGIRIPPEILQGATVVREGGPAP